MISQRLLVERARVARLVVPDEQVAQVIAGIDAFRDEGKFDKKRYETVLADQGMTPLIFEARVRDELMGQQMQDAYAQNGFAAKTIAANVFRLNEQQRVVKVSTISFQTFMSQAKVEDSELKQYYEQNKNEFQVQEQAKVEYVKFSADDLLAKVEVNKEDVHNYYEGHQSEYGTPEERRAAHILITVKPTAPQAEQDAAKAKAEQLLEQARKNPAKFDELAKNNSQDPGSAANGGDLGYFGRGAMVKPFEDAAFADRRDQRSGEDGFRLSHHQAGRDQTLQDFAVR